MYGTPEDTKHGVMVPSLVANYGFLPESHTNEYPTFKQRLPTDKSGGVFPNSTALTSSDMPSILVMMAKSKVGCPRAVEILTGSLKGALVPASALREAFWYRMVRSACVHNPCRGCHRLISPYICIASSFDSSMWKAIGMSPSGSPRVLPHTPH